MKAGIFSFFFLFFHISSTNAERSSVATSDTSNHTNIFQYSPSHNNFGFSPNIQTRLPSDFNYAGWLKVGTSLWEFDSKAFTAHDQWHISEISAWGNGDGISATIECYCSQFILFGSKKRQTGYVKISIDDHFITEVLTYVNANDMFNQTLYTSPEMKFGKHKIFLQHRKESPYDGIVLAYLLVKPYPINYGNYVTLPSIDSIDSYHQLEVGQPQTFSFTGRRFFLFGNKRSGLGSLKITVNGRDTTISLSNTQTLNNALLHQSEELPDETYQVSLEAINSAAEISFLSYTNQPVDGHFVPCSEMTKEGAWFPYSDYEGAMYTYEAQAKAKYQIYGTNFFVYGAKDASFSQLSVQYEGGKSSTTTDPINVHSTTKETHVSLFDSPSLPVQNYQVAMTCLSQENRNSIAIFYLYYTLVYHPPQETEVIHHSKWDKTGTWNEINGCLFSSNSGATLTTKFRGDRFWLEGAAGPNFGIAEISIDSEVITQISLHKEVRAENCIYFESPILSFDYHSVQIKCVESNITLHQLLYPNLFINISTDQLTYYPGHGTTPDKWRTPLDPGSGADTGSYVYVLDAKVSYEFFGSRAFFYGNQAESYGEIEVYIDGKHVDTFDAYFNIPVNRKITQVILYGSDYLPFGRHTIEFKNANTQHSNGNQRYHMQIQGILIDPLPVSGGHVIGPDEMLTRSTGWTELTNYPRLRTTTAGCTITIKFFGTRFWLTGTRFVSSTTFSVQIDGKSPQDHSVSTTSQYCVGCNQLLFESEIMELKEHTVLISSKTGTLEISNFFYITQPKDAIIISSEQMSLSNEADWTTEYNNQISTTVPSAYANFNIYGNQIWILGGIGPQYGSIELSFNDKLMNTINSTNENTQFESLLYSASFPIDSYSVKLANKEDSKIGLHYIYYFSPNNDIPSDVLSLDISEATKSSGWTESNGKYSAESAGKSFTFSYQGTRFFIIGSTSCYFGELIIYFDNVRLATISLYSETLLTDVAVFSSPENPRFGDHTVRFETKDSRRVEISGFKYLPLHFVNITFLDFKYSNHGWVTTSPYVSTCNELNCSASSTFYGTKVILECNRGSNLGEMDIRIDGRFVTQIDASSTSRQTHQYLFESDELDYGQHTINITNRNSKDGHRIEICNILVCPLTKHGGATTTFQNLLYNIWDPRPNGWLPPANVIDCMSDCGAITQSFYGTKFLISGTRGQNSGSFDILIDDYSTNVDTAIPTSSSYLYDKTLIYESPVLPLGHHTIVINKTDQKRVRFYEFFYITQPLHATTVPANQFQIGNQNSNNKNSITLLDTAQFHMYGTTFWIFGQGSITRENIAIKLNGKEVGFNIEETDSFLNMKMIHLSEATSLDYSLIEIINKGQSEVTLNFAYYLYDQELTLSTDPAITRYNSDKISSESWTPLVYEREEVDVEGISTTSPDSVLTIPFEGDQFWIEGSYDPSFGLVEIVLDDNELTRVSLYREQHQSNQIYYESAPIEYKPHVLALKNVDGKEISFHILYVNVTASYQFTLSTYFSDSAQFSESTKFTESTEFTESTQFSSSSDFSDSNEFTGTPTFTPSFSFTPTVDFTTSSGFSSSSDFSLSSDFTESISFSLTPSDFFTHSVSFSESNSLISRFIPTEVPTPFVPNENEGDDKGSVPIGLIVGVVIAVIVVVLVIILLILIIRRRKNDEHHSEDPIEFTATSITNTMYQQTQSDQNDAPDSFGDYDPFNQAIEEIGA